MNKQEIKDNKLIASVDHYSRHYKMSIVLFLLGLFSLITVFAEPNDSSLINDDRFMVGAYIYLWLTAIASVYYQAKIEHIKSIQYYKSKLNAEENN